MIRKEVKMKIAVLVRLGCLPKQIDLQRWQESFPASIVSRPIGNSREGVPDCALNKTKIELLCKGLNQILIDTPFIESWMTTK